MPKNKLQKKKERERRVAQKKHAAAQERVQEKSEKETETAFPKAKKTFTPATLPKQDHVATNKKSPFTQRRGGS